MNIVRRQPTPPAPATNAAYFDWDPFKMMRDMMRWDPFREMAPVGLEPAKVNFWPDIDVKENGKEFVFKADLPGVAEKDVEVSLQGNRLTLTGKREEEKKEETETYFSCERSYGSFTRSFTLPAGTDADKVRADLKEGVLTIVVPKKPETQPKKIEIKNGGEKK